MCLLPGLVRACSPFPTKSHFPDFIGPQKLAVGGTDGKILLFEVSTQALLHARFSFQSARVNSLAFDVSGARLAAGSLDESIRVYSLAAPSTVLTAKNVHRGGVASVLWESDDVLVSGGADGAVKKLKV